jgi:DMSO reductase anchor subunit
MKGMNLEDIDQQEELMTYLKHVDWNTPYGWSLALVFAAVLLLFFASLYKLFKLKGVPGWTALIPFLNYSVMAQIGGLPAISILLLFVPYINFVFAMVLIFKYFNPNLNIKVNHNCQRTFRVLILRILIKFSDFSKFKNKIKIFL